MASQVTTAWVGIAGNVAPGCSLHVQTQEVPVTSPSCSPVHRRNKLFSTCSDKSVLKDSWIETWKSASCFLGRWTWWLRWCFPPCLLPSLPACLPASPGLRVGKFQWNIAPVESPAQSERGGDVTSRRRVRSNFTGSSESGWSLWTELCV